jgi:hypothetical protein
VFDPAVTCDVEQIVMAGTVGHTVAEPQSDEPWSGRTPANSGSERASKCCHERLPGLLTTGSAQVAVADAESIRLCVLIDIWNATR